MRGTGVWFPPARLIHGPEGGKYPRTGEVLVGSIDEMGDHVSRKEEGR